MAIPGATTYRIYVWNKRWLVHGSYTDREEAAEQAEALWWKGHRVRVVPPVSLGLPPLPGQYMAEP